MGKIVVGILAHVDAGKTTLSEGMLYTAGAIRTMGRVDNRDAFLDTYALERERGITIFSKQAVFSLGTTQVTLLDTPGHVDFSPEMERTLQVLDYAILVISGADGVQGHTRTLWNLLKRYEIPTFVFVNKMDQPDNLQSEILTELQDFSDKIVAFSCYEQGTIHTSEDFYESIAMASEDETILNTYMEQGALSDTCIQTMIKQRHIIPCYFGSALKGIGVDALLNGLDAYTTDAYQTLTEAPFGARVYKITRDEKGNRLAHIKVMQGTLSVRDTIGEEKVTQIRIYNGEHYQTVPTVTAGHICSITGLETAQAGDGIGDYSDNPMACIEPVISYTITFDEAVSTRLMYTKIKDLDEELPELHLTWNEPTETIQIMLMGPVQIEILTQLIKNRCGVVPTFDNGKILYKETIAQPVIGVGHFEPLRHYAEAHIRIEPAERGSGVDASLDCSEDILAKNWQRLVYTHLLERTHRGTKIGAPLTDVHFTVINGRAHTKHTEGGDFRQATYRAVRQGLMEAGTIILEPEYDFTLEIPASMIGHAMTDLQSMYAVMEAPEQLGDRAIIRGHGPVATLRDYQLHVRAFTKGQGEFQVSFRGYMPCHNEEEVIQTHPYDPEADLRNPTSSVFCAHGSGFLVPWDQVKAYMHVSDATDTEQEQAEYTVHSRENFDYSIGLDEIDAILSGQTANQNAKKQIYKKKIVRHTETYTGKASKVIVTPKEKRLIVDGYNVIFAWESLTELAKTNLDAAKDKLISLLSNYQGITGVKTLLVFDGYKVKGNHGSTNVQEDIEIVHTKENQTADQFIEAYTHENEGQYQMTVATSDGLIQTITRGAGCQIISSRELYSAMEAAAKELREMYDIK
jgi:ribosomal protection tetracycline resistance protein